MIVSSERFVPHTLAHLTQAGVFPSPLPEAAYAKMQQEYEALADVEVLRIVYESDGLKVTGLMAVPTSIVPGQHPVLVYNRGGRKEYGKLTLISVLRSMAPFARKGYLVFASNYRGNDGGEGSEEFGGSEVNDVLNLLAIARAHPGFDGRNAYMSGHSRGGMMTYMALRRGAQVNAAISIAGMSDIWQDGQSTFDRLIPVKGDEREAAYRSRSALCWPQDIATPLLLLHGDADKDIPVSHSVRLAEAMKEAGRECELVIYPGGNHTLFRFWDDVLARCFTWLERHRQ